MKLPEMKSAPEVLAEQLKDPAFREEWERTTLAGAVANRVVVYRAERGLSQTQLARKLGVSQPLVARLEAGEHSRPLRRSHVSPDTWAWSFMYTSRLARWN